jgi:PAS domain S-box-containing protein
LSYCFPSAVQVGFAAIVSCGNLSTENSTPATRNNPGRRRARSPKRKASRKIYAQRRKAEEALRRSDLPFRRYFNLGLIGMAITSPTKGTIEVNDELCRILGYERRELLQKSWPEMTHPEDVAADVAQFNRVLAGEIDSLEKRLKHFTARRQAEWGWGCVSVVRSYGATKAKAPRSLSCCRSETA